MKLIVGLGNPGREYEGTRHNVGFMAIDEIVASVGLSFNRSKFGGLYCNGLVFGDLVMFLKPQEYINLSGDVIKKFVDFFNIDLSDVLIIHDDLDLDVGVLKLKLKGGSGGHNGLKNIEANFKTQEYKRVKIGISNNKLYDTKDYVLGKIVGSDLDLINKTIAKMPDLFRDYLVMSFENLMNKYN